jgi:hypothetical protein
MKKTIILTIMLLFLVDYNFAQRTPQELGKFAFLMFKNRDYAMLDTITPKCKDVIKILLNIDTSFNFVQAPDFERKYIAHDNLFKEKCRAIMTDTIELNINWSSATIETIEINQKTDEQQSLDARSLMLCYLDIYFTSDNKKYLLQFKGIYRNNGIYKLGEKCRIKPVIK